MPSGTSFYVTPSTGRWERCSECYREVFARSAARRAERAPIEVVAVAAARPRRRRARGERRFGVEIEFIGDRYALGNAMRAEGLSCSDEGYNHHTRTHWKIVSDATVDGGAELVSPPLYGEDGKRQIEAAGRALASVGCSANRTCGLHVHHEVTDLSLASFGRLFRLWYQTQVGIDELVSPSRRNGQFSHHLTETDVQRCESLSSMSRDLASVQLRGDRYRSLNVQSYSSYGTVEVRLHQGTVDAAKILAWVEFGQAMVAYASTDKDLFTTDKAVMILLRLDTMKSEVAVYLAERAIELNDPTEVSTEHMTQSHPALPTATALADRRTLRQISIDQHGEFRAGCPECSNVFNAQYAAV